MRLPRPRPGLAEAGRVASRASAVLAVGRGTTFRSRRAPRMPGAVTAAPAVFTALAKARLEPKPFVAPAGLLTGKGSGSREGEMAGRGTAGRAKPGRAPVASPGAIGPTKAGSAAAGFLAASPGAGFSEPAVAAAIAAVRRLAKAATISAAGDGGTSSSAAGSGTSSAIGASGTSGLAAAGVPPARLAAAALAVTGLAVTGLAVTGLATTGLATTGLATTGLEAVAARSGFGSDLAANRDAVAGAGAQAGSSLWWPSDAIGAGAKVDAGGGGRRAAAGSSKAVALGWALGWAIGRGKGPGAVCASRTNGSADCGFAASESRASGAVST